jgi:CsoR family transcriptional regulator, copper-sensing transcriptional repressor
MDAGTRRKLQARLKRVSGQVQGIQRMIDEDRYCLDVLSQIAAVRSALDALGVELLSNHVEHCVTGGPEAHPQAKGMSTGELTAELRTALDRFLR